MEAECKSDLILMQVGTKVSAQIMQGFQHKILCAKLQCMRVSWASGIVYESFPVWILTKGAFD